MHEPDTESETVRQKIVRNASEKPLLAVYVVLMLLLAGGFLVAGVVVFSGDVLRFLGSLFDALLG
jgi:hypothetical protein